MKTITIPLSEFTALCKITERSLRERFDNGDDEAILEAKKAGLMDLADELERDRIAEREPITDLMESQMGAFKSIFGQVDCHGVEREDYLYQQRKGVRG